MKRTLFLSLLALAIFSTSASASHNFTATYVNFDQNYYSNEVQYVYPTYTDSLRYYNSNNYTYSNDFSRIETDYTTDTTYTAYKKQKCVLAGDIQLGEDMAFYNVSIYAIEKNYSNSNYASATLTGTKGTFFLNSAVTRLWTSPIQYSITMLDGVSLSGYTGYIDNEKSAAYGLIAATGGNKHEILISRNYGAINLSNNSVTSTEQAPLKHLYSTVFTAIDSYFIGGEGNSFIQVDGNSNPNGTAVSISGNQTKQTFDGGSDMYHAYAGAIYASGSCDVSVSSNSGSVLIQNNQVSSAGSHATGGAIALHGTDQLVRLNSNSSLNLSGNKAISTWSNPDKSAEYVTAGGAIYAATATVSIDTNGVYGDRDYTLSICNNSAEMDNGNVRGGAIDAHTLTMHGNRNGVQISGNYAITKTGTYSALGGALSAATSEGRHSIRETGDMWRDGIGYVDILNNYAKSESTQGTARGGFFYGADGTTLEISKNYGSINIQGNHVSTVNGADNAALGGAIYGSSLIISDNSGSVNIYGNYEQYGDKYRMRAVYLDSADANSTLSLSAVSGKSIKFEDAVYANVKNITINGGETGSGTVIFSGGNVERNFSNLGIENVSDEELAASRTSYFGAVINVMGGTLEACNGALLQGKGMEVVANSNATVRLNNAAMQHSGGIVRFYENTTLAAAGSSTLEAGYLQMFAGSCMQFNLDSTNATTAALTYTGDLSLDGTINVEVNLSNRTYKGGTLKMLALTEGDWDWDAQKKVISYQIANSKLMGTTSWDAENKTLVFTCWEAEEGKKISWSGNGGNQTWDSNSDNWVYDGKQMGFTGLNAIYFEDAGAGEISVKGAITTGDIYVSNSTGKNYYWKAADTSAKLTGAHGLTKNGEGTLRIGTDMDYTGNTAVEEGKLILEGQASLKGSFTNNAEVEVSGNVTLQKYSGTGNMQICNDGSLTFGSATITKGDGQTSAQLKGSTGAEEYSTANEQYEIKNGKVTTSGATETSIANKLTNTSVTNNSSKALKLTNGDNTLSAVEADKGDVYVYNYKPTNELDKLLLADGRTIGFYKYDDDTKESTITIAKAAEFGKNTTLLANFELKSGATLMMTDTVTMGSTITLNAGAELEGNIYDKVLTLSDIGASIVLFDSVDYLILKHDGQQEEYEMGELTTESQVLASTYFRNLSPSNDLYITFDAQNGGQVCITKGEALVVPEPATATLSLLALAALAARRRRRG